MQKQHAVAVLLAELDQIDLGAATAMRSSEARKYMPAVGPAAAHSRRLVLDRRRAPAARRCAGPERHGVSSSSQSRRPAPSWSATTTTRLPFSRRTAVRLHAASGGRRVTHGTTKHAALERIGLSRRGARRLPRWRWRPRARGRSDGRRRQRRAAGSAHRGRGSASRTR